jgi:hypothetical protein
MDLIPLSSVHGLAGFDRVKYFLKNTFYTVIQD